MSRNQLSWIVALLATLAAIFLHVVFLTHAGGLWRDEASFVQLATLPSWHDVWRMLGHDNCPILLPAITRMWCAAGWGKTDFGLRILGLIIGLLLLAMFWVASRMMRRGVPLLPLALVAVNITMIRGGDSLRSYGLGSALNVLVLPLFWHVARKPTSVNVLLGALVAVLSVQCLYQNAFFVFAAGCGGIAVCISQRRWRDTLWLFGIGALAAASLVPYVRIVGEAQEWYILEKLGFDFSHGWGKFSTAVGLQGLGFNWLWLALCLLAIGISFLAVSTHARSSSVVAHRTLILFGSMALVVGVVGFVVFLKIANLGSELWYYIPLMAFVAVCLDVVLPVCHRWAQPALTVFAAITVIVSFMIGLPALECRQTNVDLVAVRLAREAAPNDYIVVNPWYFGVSFERYYQGVTPWATVPPLADHGLHRYDLVKAEMQMENPLQPVLDKIASTLQSGNHVWIVGFLPLPQTPPPDINPAPNNPWGWQEDPYSQNWSEKVGYFFTSHATQCAEVAIPASSGVNSYEDLHVAWIAGWQLSPASTTSQ